MKCTNWKIFIALIISGAQITVILGIPLFQQGTPHNLRGVTEYEIEEQTSVPYFSHWNNCLNSCDRHTHSPKTLDSEYEQCDAMSNKLKLK